MPDLRTDRQVVSSGVIQSLSRQYVDQDTGRVACRLCDGQPRTWQTHEWYVKRNTVPRDKQAPIFCIENCVPVCRSCHEEFGQTLTGLKILLLKQSKFLGAKRIATWYRSLPKHGITISSRRTWEDRKWPPTIGLLWTNLVAEMQGIPSGQDWTVPTQSRSQVDWRSWVYHRWQGKRPRWGKGTIVSKKNGVSRGRFEAVIEEAYWLHRLAFVKDIQLSELWRTYRSL